MRFPEEPALSPESRRYLAETPIARRKERGQFFTPAPLRRELLKGLELGERPRILDPACGTGEFLRTARLWWPAARLTGFELDGDLVELARRAVPDALVRQTDALREPWRPEFDAVIGNPPYFEFKADAPLRRRYATAISGRPNSYALFVKMGLEMLKEGGVLAFVLPPSMNNGAYFRALRREILATSRIEKLTILPATDLFSGANQTVMLLRLVKGEGGDDRHVFRRGPFTLFCEDPARLLDLYQGACTLGELGCTVRTGSVVWNQVKERLTADARGAARLIWAHNIRPDGLDFTIRPGKPPFVRGRQPWIGPAVVVNRITGRGLRARLRAAVVGEEVEYLAENHVNVVLPPGGWEEQRVAAVAAALLDERALNAVRRLTGNTQISASELANLIPLRFDAEAP